MVSSACVVVVVDLVVVVDSVVVVVGSVVVVDSVVLVSVVALVTNSTSRSAKTTSSNASDTALSFRSTVEANCGSRTTVCT